MCVCVCARASVCVCVCVFKSTPNFPFLEPKLSSGYPLYLKQIQLLAVYGELLA